jgi:hypothetical protein
MQTIALIIVLQVMVTLLTGCAEFPIAAKIEEMNKLNCKPADSSMCNGWEK